MNNENQPNQDLVVSGVSADTMLSLAEFQRISGLPDQAVLYLLRAGALPVVVKDDTNIFIDPRKLDSAGLRVKLLQAEEEFRSQWQEVIEERCAYIIADELARMAAEFSRLGVTTPSSSEELP